MLMRCGLAQVIGHNANVSKDEVGRVRRANRGQGAQRISVFADGLRVWAPIQCERPAFTRQDRPEENAMLKSAAEKYLAARKPQPPPR